MLRTEREGPVNAASFKPIISEVKELNTRFLPSYNAGLVCNSMSHAHMLSCVQLFAIPWTVAHQVPLSMEFSRQEYWSGLPFPSPIHACMLSHFGHVHLFATPWTVACQTPLSVGVLQARIWSGLPSPPPEDLLNPRI